MSSSRVLLAGALVATLLAPASAETPYFSRSDLQNAIARLDATDLEGRRWNVATLKGRVVLLEFWATWCAPCLQQVPMLRELREAYRPDQFEIVAVSLNSSSRRDFIAWINRQGIEWPQIHDGRAFSSPTVRLFGVNALPASLLLDERGAIVAANLRGDALKRAVAALVRR